MSNHDRDDSQPSGGDASLKNAWQEASVEQPPARLDAAIIAAARKAVADRDQPQVAPPAGQASRNWFARWQPLAAAATVAGLAFVLVQTLPRDRDRELPTQWPEPVPAASSAKVQPESPRTREETDETDLAGREKSLSGEHSNGPGALGQAGGESSAASRRGAIPAPPVKPAQAVTTADTATASDSASAAAPVAASAGREEAAEDAASGLHRKAAESDMAGRTAAPAMSAPGAVASGERSLSNAAPTNSATRAADIAARYSAGDLAGAATALRVFRAVDPDADRYLPPSLHDWARTVQ